MSIASMEEISECAIRDILDKELLKGYIGIGRNYLFIGAITDRKQGNRG